MHLICAGINHKTASVEMREKFSLTKDQLRQKLDDFDEAVILSTCNRFEIYSVNDSEPSTNQLHYLYRDEDCIRHLFSVASSLDSLILGEGQILSQVKDAYRIAKNFGKTSTILNTLFNRAIACGKRVRNETRIAYNAVSVSYAAVELAQKTLGDLQSRKVLLFGAGKMARLSAQYLISHGVEKIFVANRHLDRAQDLAEEFHGEAIPWEKSFEVDVDLIITSTGAPHYVIKKSAMEDLIRRRGDREILLIDIAVPRDVDPEVESLPNIRLFNIDDLESVVEQNLREREKESMLAKQIVEEEVQSLMDRFKYLSFRPLMANLSERADSIRQREIRRVASKLPRLTSEEWKSIDQMTRMIVRKILRDPMASMNSAAGTSKEQFYTAAMKSLFQLEEKSL